MSRVDRGKLRTYRLFKTEYKVETYCKLLMPYSHRAAFAKFRCGVAPFRIETGGYENLDVGQRLDAIFVTLNKLKTSRM